MIGRTLGARYAVEQQIGEGGMAIVYTALDIDLDRRVAVKVLRPEFANDDEFVRRFAREARAAAQLCHPNIVQVYDVGRDNGTNYIVMEHVEGQTLKDKIRAEAPLPADQAVAFARQVLGALAHAHSHGVVHRDIKPQNILLTGDGEIKVADFGIARQIGGATLADTKVLMGTAYYVSPEQARGRYTGAQSDLYSLGVVLYEMLSGKLPFDGDTAVTVAIKHLQEEAPPLVTFNRHVPESLDLIVRKALAKDTARRYATAQDFLLDLERYDTLDLAALSASSNSSQDRTQVLPPLTLHHAAGADDAAAVAGGAELDGDDDNGLLTTTAAASRRGLRWLPWLAAALALFGGTAYAAYFVSSWLNPPSIEVPHLVGTDYEQAQRLLADYDVRLVVTAYRHDNDMAAGLVLWQKPAHGDLVKAGGQVSVIVSRGPQWVENGVPDVRGLLRQAAELELKRAGLQVEVEERFHPLVPAGRVIEQNPQAGTRVIAETPVRIVISRGPELATVTLPSFVGRPLPEVRQQVEELGVEIGSIETQVSDYPPEFVQDQRPAAGSAIKPGDKIELVISQGNGLEPHIARVTVILPGEPAKQRVEIRVRDRSERIVHIGDHVGGSEYEAKVYWYGDEAEVTVFVGGELVDRINLTRDGGADE